MIEFEIHQLIPAFLMNDRNGYAMAKALEAGIRFMLRVIGNGLAIVTDVDAMPEWRLDEAAWEYNIPYDYNADISIKREWIMNASEMSRLYGTPEAVHRYMAAYFDRINVEESWEYGGEPFHFRVIFPGIWTPEKVAWATKSIFMVKNVRSILDLYNFENEWKGELYAGSAMYGDQSCTYSVAAIPSDDVMWYSDELDHMLMDETGMVLFVEGTT